LNYRKSYANLIGRGKRGKKTPQNQGVNPITSKGKEHCSSRQEDTERTELLRFAQRPKREEGERKRAVVLSACTGGKSNNPLFVLPKKGPLLLLFDVKEPRKHLKKIKSIVSYTGARRKKGERIPDRSKGTLFLFPERRKGLRSIKLPSKKTKTSRMHQEREGLLVPSEERHVLLFATLPNRED